jgi:hypothetical protein
VNKAVSLLSLLCWMRRNGFCQCGAESNGLKAIEGERLFCLRPAMVRQKAIASGRGSIGI